MKKTWLVLLGCLLLSVPFARAQIQAQIPASEYNALAALYNSTGGALWTSNTGWLNPQAPSWYGVTVTSNHVTALNLPLNHLSGTIPTNLGDLTRLTNLNVGVNNLSGIIPTNLGTLPRLQNLNLFVNQLSGTVPTTLASLSNLQVLNLSYNRLSGSIPGVLASLSNLQTLILADNHFTGNIPANLGSLPQLGFLDLDNNDLTQAIPSALGNLTHMSFLDLSYNQLSGSVPTNLGNLTNLTSLNLSYNELNGTIPSAFVNLGQFQTLLLNDNQLSGTIPTNLGRLTNLTSLDLSSNQLSGDMPAGGVFANAQIDIAGNYLNIASGTQSLSNLTAMISSGNTVIYIPQNGTNVPVTSLQVSLSPPAIVTAGAMWQVDGGLLQSSGTTLTNLNFGIHTIGFSPVPGWITPNNAILTLPATQATLYTATYVSASAGTLQVTITPTNATGAGAGWQVDGGSNLSSGTIASNLVAGSHLVSFFSVPGWAAPSSQFVTLTNGAATAISVNYTAANPMTNGVILLTNGAGTISHGTWPASLVPGKNYTVNATPKTGNFFLNWEGGTNPPYGVLSAKASYAFTMPSTNLVLEANFASNTFPAVAGAYRGLFAPLNGQRQQTSSGSFNFTLAASGTISGTLYFGSPTNPVTLSGKFAPDGSAQLTSKQHGGATLTISLQLNLPNQSVTGTISGGGFVSQLTGYRNVFDSQNPATNYEGRYTLIIPGTTNRALGPYGTSYGTVTISATGTLTFAGSLADGTSVSQSSVISAGGYWPLYLTLHGGAGSLWSWVYFNNGTLTAPTSASWLSASINNISTNSSTNSTTNTIQTSSLRAGFTNQAATIIGYSYSSNPPLLNLTDGIVVLTGGVLPFPVTNEISFAPNGGVTFTNSAEDTNKLTLTVNKTTGLISGIFHNPAKPSQTIKVNGVLLQGQNAAQGYFIETNQSGNFNLFAQ